MPRFMNSYDNPFMSMQPRSLGMDGFMSPRSLAEMDYDSGMGGMMGGMMGPPIMPMGGKYKLNQNY